MTTTIIDWFGIAGRVCVITGAGGGMGHAMAASFAAAGARVVLLDRDLARAQHAAAEANQHGGQAVALVCDVADPEAVTAAAAHAHAAVGPADILINAAGLLRAGPLRSLTFAEWNALISVNLTGCFLCAQAFGEHMITRGHGSIVHIASIAAHNPQGASGAYSVSKAGVVMLSQQLATEWGPLGIRSNVVSPGMIRTPMSEAFYTDPSVVERRKAVVPTGRIGTAQDIADAALFLASERASYINGDEVIVDGGFTRKIMDLVPRPFSK